jgi:hypothetical protein
MTSATSRVVRVFISSTFRNSGAGRKVRATRVAFGPSRWLRTSPHSTEGTIVTSVN